MMLRLILIRHGKSSWDDPFGDDHARVLNGRGRASATAIGTWLAEHGYRPDTILCSDSERTKETAALIMPALSPAPRLTLSKALYHAAPDTVLDVLHRQTAPVVAVIAHNPGLGMLANVLVTESPNHRRFSDYPTCATTVIDFAVENWSDVKRMTGTCIDFTVPRDLIGTTGQDIE